MKAQTWILTFLGFALFCMVQTASAGTALYFSGPDGEYISQGQEYYLDIADGYQIVVNHNNNNSYSFYFSNPSAPPAKQHWWTVDFSAANSKRLGHGIYLGATREGFANGVPGLDLFGDGRGNNAVAGYFTVLQAVYDNQSNLIEFAADFVLQGDTPGKIFGSVRYNSDIPLVNTLR
jgi:hypothetical protein